jgi:HAD superfamily hydrolase (TIGR01509 family)
MNTWGVLWDMDGVLVDTGDLHYQTWAGIFAEQGITFSYQLFRDTFGMRNAEILPLWLGRPLQPEEIDQISCAKEARFRQAARGHVEALPGVHYWLGQFQVRGYSQAIASSAPPENIEMLVSELGIRRYFLALVSASGLPGKPDPAVFVQAAQQIHVPPERCIVIEDSVAGVEAARRAGMKCIAVTTTHPPAALSAASLIVERLDNLSEEHLRSLREDLAKH